MKHKIYGPPGTGKTSRLIELLEQEIKNGTKPERIAFLTFTRAAREEALARIEKTEKEVPYVRTIHAICYRQMGVTQDQVAKPSDIGGFGKSLGVRLNGNNFDPWIEEFSRTFEAPSRDDLLLQINHKGRHKGLLLKDSLAQENSDIDYKYAVWFTKAYRAWKTSKNILDYTDLLMRYLDYGKPLDIDVIFVDEAQDLSSLQWEVVDKLGARAQRMYICGDDDQAIFTWAGAEAEAFQNYVTDTSEVLHQSHRVSIAVYNEAMKIANRIKNRVPKSYLPTQSEGSVGTIFSLLSAEFDQKTFILFRNHYRGHDLARALIDQGIPYIGHGSPLTEAEVRMALRAWYLLIKKREVPRLLVKALLKFTDDNYSYLNKRKLPDKEFFSIEEVFIKIPHWSDWKKYLFKISGQDIIDGFIRTSGFNRTSKPKVELLSIHRSKGREAHTVILDLEISRAVYESWTRQGDDENRVFYVGVTRAKERLVYLMASGGYSYSV